MYFQKTLIIFFFFLSSVVFSQEKTDHKVVRGESLYSIAQKYGVKPSEILDLNPKIKGSLQLNTILQIPLKISKNKSKYITHEVLPKETLYGLSKKYSISIEELKKENSFIETRGLKVGDLLMIPVLPAIVAFESERGYREIENGKEIVVKSVQEPKGDLKEAGFHTVLVKETKYGISKKYGITVAELEFLNPEIKQGLLIGYKLKINKKEVEDQFVSQITQQKENVKVKDSLESAVSLVKSIESQKGVKDNVVVKPQIEEEEEGVVAGSNLEEMQSKILPESSRSLLKENSDKVEYLIAKASENLGARYKSGAIGNGEFDCSGLIFSVYKSLDIVLPRTSVDMAQNAGVKVDKSQAKKGDLIFFETLGKGRISHVGMVIEVLADEIKFIHSSTSSGVIISSTKELYYSKRFIQINRILIE